MKHETKVTLIDLLKMEILRCAKQMAFDVRPSECEENYRKEIRLREMLNELEKEPIS